MDKEVVEVLSDIYLKKIAEQYGYSKFHKTTPYLSIEGSPYSEGNDKELIAEFCSISNEIIVYWRNIKDEESLIRSLVHEYQHYLQSPSWMQRYYKQGYSYTDHPYEIQAYKEEENWNKFLINRL
jgi:hypothetical protein